MSKLEIAFAGSFVPPLRTSELREIKQVITNGRITCKLE